MKLLQAVIDDVLVDIVTSVIQTEDERHHCDLVFKIFKQKSLEKISISFSFNVPKGGETMTPNEKLLLEALMFHDGVLPITDVRDDMRPALEKLDPQEARKLKRKFRKQWRKLAKQHCEKKGISTEKYMQEKMGAGKPPTHIAFSQRRRLVQAHYLDNIIRPKLKEFESGNTDRKPISSKP